jgi:hypothetical protein
MNSQTYQEVIKWLIGLNEMEKRELLDVILRRD